MKHLLVAIILLLASDTSAQEHQHSFEEHIPKEALKSEKFFTLTVENDFFGAYTDKNYTNGLRLTYFDVGHQAPLAARWLASLLPAFEVSETTSVYYSLGQNLYTPENISAITPDPNDQPYAGFLYASTGFTNIMDSYIDDFELTLGVVGPAALGGEVQSNFHELINDTDPKGWDYQLKNEPGLILSWRRQWTKAYAHMVVDDYYLRVMPHAGVTLGNIYTYANAGATMQFVPKDDRRQSLPLRVRPAIPGSGYFSRSEKDWSWMLFAGLDWRVIGRNIFLDGNTFEDSPSVDKKRFVGDINAGLALTYDNVRISYTLNWRSEEFDRQGDSHIFGVISVGYRF